MTETLPGGPGPYDDYKPGSKDSFGRVIKTVIGRHRHMIVYITERREIGWHYKDLPERLRPAVTEFEMLLSDAGRSLPKRLHTPAIDLIGKSLYAALLCPDGEDPKTRFDQAKNFIQGKAVERARLTYILLSLLSAALLLVAADTILLHLLSFPVGIVAGMGGGLLGASISIIQRGRKLPVNPIDSPLYLGFQGLLRVVLGLIFGALLMVASQANLVLGTIAANPSALFFVSVAAGMSERFVPDLLVRSLESESAKPPD